MKLIFTLLFAITLCSQSFGQLEEGAIAPDFTAVDLNGNQHNLYDLLNEGKIVILDIFATWCGPCWTYHQGHTLRDIYEEFGPDGTDEVYVFAIEGDSRTNEACIYNESDCNFSTIGNWVEGIPYPMIDNALIASSYKISFYPTIYMVYPDRTSTQMGQAPYEGVIETMEMAASLTAGYNPVFFSADITDGSFCDQSVEVIPSLDIQNMGTETIYTADIIVSYNDEVVYQEPWSGELKSYQIIEQLSMPEFLVQENTFFKFSFANINGNENLSLDYSTEIVVNTTNLLTLKIETDEAEDISSFNYILRNQDTGQLLANESIMIDEAVTEKTIILPEEGCYLFLLIDSGDFGKSANVTIKDDQNNTVYKNAGTLEADVISANVTMLTNAKDLSNEIDLNLAPNPTSEFIHLNITNDNYTLSIVDISGKQLINNMLSNYKSGSTYKVDLSNFDTGMYILQLKNDKGYITERIIVE